MGQWECVGLPTLWLRQLAAV